METFAADSQSLPIRVSISNDIVMAHFHYNGNSME